MFIIKGRLLGTVLALLIAAIGATLLSGGPDIDSAASGAVAAPLAALAAR